MRRPHSIGFILIWLATLSLPRSLYATSFSEMVVFGASYHLASRSDGPTWVDYLAKDLDLPIRNYAMSGASTADVRSQIGAYTRARERRGNAPVDPDALYVSLDWSYSADALRDVLGAPAPSAPGAIANIVQLVEAGARNIVVGRARWAVENSPFWNDYATAAPAVRAAETEFLTELSALRESYDVNVYEADMNLLAERVIPDPAAFGFVDFTSLRDPDQEGKFVWMADGRHVTTAYNRLMANEFLAALSVPEPSTLVHLAVLLVVLPHRRKRYHLADRTTTEPSRRCR